MVQQYSKSVLTIFGKKVVTGGDCRRRYIFIIFYWKKFWMNKLQLKVRQRQNHIWQKKSLLHFRDTKNQNWSEPNLIASNLRWFITSLNIKFAFKVKCRIFFPSSDMLYNGRFVYVVLDEDGAQWQKCLKSIETALWWVRGQLFV